MDMNGRVATITALLVALVASIAASWLTYRPIEPLQPAGAADTGNAAGRGGTGFIPLDASVTYIYNTSDIDHFKLQFDTQGTWEVAGYNLQTPPANYSYMSSQHAHNVTEEDGGVLFHQVKGEPAIITLTLVDPYSENVSIVYTAGSYTYNPDGSYFFWGVGSTKPHIVPSPYSYSIPEFGAWIGGLGG